MRPRAFLYITLLSLGAALYPLTGSVALDLVEYLPVLALLTIFSFLTQVYELEILPKWLLSTQIAVGVAAVLIGGHPLAFWVVLLSTLPAEVLLRWDNLQGGIRRFLAPILFNTAQLLLTVWATGAVYRFVLSLAPASELLLPAKIAAFFTYVLVNNSLVALMIALDNGASFSKVLRAALRNLHLQFATMGVLAMLMAALYQVSTVYLALAVVPLALVHYSTRNYLRLRRESHLAFKRIAELLAERDEYTGTHSDDVEQLTVKLAEAMGLPDDEVEAITAGAAIHDIGKIAIPDAILHKLGPLDPGEFETMKQHTIIGAEIIQHLEIYRRVVPIVRHEHEHWDGGGYPDGLAGERIPIGARIVAVADVYSALTTERAYRPPQGKPLKYSRTEATAILNDMAGTVLDPSIVALFTRFLDRQEARGHALP